MSISNIKHIVYIMMENRSFDNVLGWLYDSSNLPQHNIPSQSPTTFNGLSTTFYNEDKNREKHYVVKGVQHTNTPSVDPHEEFEHVNTQLFGSVTPSASTIPGMSGFYEDYATTSSGTPSEIMESYTPAELPIINGLAKNFAVSDAYFSSVPTQTNANRAFAAAGNSLGPNDDSKLEGFVNNRNSGFPNAKPTGKQFNQKTMWNVMTDNGITDWTIFYSKADSTIGDLPLPASFYNDVLGAENFAYTRALMTELQSSEFTANFDHIDNFFTLAALGKLPKVSFLEPCWFFAMDGQGVNGNDYHPPANLIPGEELLNSIYNTLQFNKETWEQTLLIINFDEHGGTYDHVPPPGNATPPWGTGNNDNYGTPTPDSTESNFGFDRFGVRVPLILVSPYIQASTVFRASGETPYDHTSVIATILNWLGISKDDWNLGARVYNAPTFENVLTLSTPRTDKPKLTPNTDSSPDPGSVPPNDIILQHWESFIAAAIKKKGLTKAQVAALHLKPLTDATTVAELNKLAQQEIYEILYGPADAQKPTSQQYTNAAQMIATLVQSKGLTSTQVSNLHLVPLTTAQTVAQLDVLTQQNINKINTAYPS